MRASAAASEGANPAGSGRQARVAGHFGELLQGRLGDEVALITLPCPALSVEAHWYPGGDSLEIDQPEDLLPSRIVSRLFALAKAPILGRLHLRAEMPLGGGAGASTAAILALAKVLGYSGGPEAAALCLDLEGATDPLMLPMPGQVLWSSRAGRVIETLPEVPAFDVVGGFHGPAVRTEPGDRAFADISDLIADWKPALGDRTRLAAIATESARRNQACGAVRRWPRFWMLRAHMVRWASLPPTPGRPARCCSPPARAIPRRHRRRCEPQD